MERVNHYMRLAINEAQKAYEIGEVPIGAVIVKDDKVIGIGHNTREISESSIAHAEINAIQQACLNIGHWRLTDCELYVTIEPCPMCIGAIYQSRIKTLYFGARDPKGGACGSVFNLFDYQGLNHYCLIHEGVLAQECSDLMKHFFKRLR